MLDVYGYLWNSMDFLWFTVMWDVLLIVYFCYIYIYIICCNIFTRWCHFILSIGCFFRKQNIKGKNLKGSSYHICEMFPFPLIWPPLDVRKLPINILWGQMLLPLRIANGDMVHVFVFADAVAYPMSTTSQCRFFTWLKFNMLRKIHLNERKQRTNMHFWDD